MDFLLYRAFGLDLTTTTNAWLETLSLPAKIVIPFLVMIGFSFVTRSNSEEGLDRYYTKMKTPVDPDPQADRQNLEEAYANRDALEAKKLLPGSSLEFQKPTIVDAVGFVVCFGVCFAIIGLAAFVASYVPQ